MFEQYIYHHISMFVDTLRVKVGLCSTTNVSYFRWVTIFQGETSRRGGKPHQRFERLEKKGSFSPQQNYGSTSQKWLIFPRRIRCEIWCPVICSEFCLENSRDFCSLSHIAMRFCNVRPVFSKRFSLEFSQRHCQTLMLRISFGFTWLLTLVASLHGMADFGSRHIASTPPVWIRIVLFPIRFWYKRSL